MSRFLNLSIALLSILLLTLLYSLLFGSNSYQEKALLIEQNNAKNIKNEQLKKENKDFKEDYLKKLKKRISQKKRTESTSIEIEDKFFEKKI